MAKTTLPEHIATFIQINTAGRTLLLCRSLGIKEPFRIEYHTRALREAVLALANDPDLDVVQIDRIINEQLDFLLEALKQAPATPPLRHSGNSTETAAEPSPADHKERKRRRRPADSPSAPQDISMENRLEQDRKPLRKLLQEDCVRLSLLDLDRARKLSAQLAGKSREDAETEVVAELRNNLHRQVHGFLKKISGGPWDSPKLQDELRLDIDGVSSIQGVVNLTRQILQERKAWEASTRKGLLHNLLGGRLKVSGGKK